MGLKKNPIPYFIYQLQQLTKNVKLTSDS